MGEMWQLVFEKKDDFRHFYFIFESVSLVGDFSPQKKDYLELQS